MNDYRVHRATDDRPVEFRDVIIVARRVVRVQAQHVGESIWVATGIVSEPLPSGPQLKSPVEVTATGPTENQAIEALKRRVEEFDREIGD